MLYFVYLGALVGDVFIFNYYHIYPKALRLAYLYWVAGIFVILSLGYTLYGVRYAEFTLAILNA